MMFSSKKIIGTVGTWAVLLAGMCFTACSDDDEASVGSLSFSLSTSLTDRGGLDGDGHFQGEWKSGDELVMLMTDKSGVGKRVLALSSGSAYTGSIDGDVEEDDEVAFLYPASAFTPESSDTLTQTLDVSCQDGTLSGLAAHDYIWGITNLVDNVGSFSAECEMNALMAVGKFVFTTDGVTPIQNVSRVTVTSSTEELYQQAVFDLEGGDFDSVREGAIVVKNGNGITGAVYVAFFPGEVNLHFTLSTLSGEVYEASLSEALTLEAGGVCEPLPLVCTAMPQAHIGDYYYSDGTWSAEKRTDKTCVGIVFALTDGDGNIDRSLQASPYGRVVALKDSYTSATWAASADDVEGLDNYTYVQDTLTVACLPYLDGTHDSYFSDDENEWLSAVKVDETTGAVLSWMTTGVLADFNGSKNTSYINLDSDDNAAGTYSSVYGESGGNWYLPSAGEVALLWTLHQTGVVCHAKYDCFTDFERFGYWTSSEWGEGQAWYVNFFSGVVAANSKKSSYNTRSVLQF